MVLEEINSRALPSSTAFKRRSLASATNARRSFSVRLGRNELLLVSGRRYFTECDTYLPDHLSRSPLLFQMTDSAQSFQRSSDFEPIPPPVPAYSSVPIPPPVPANLSVPIPPPVPRYHPRSQVNGSAHIQPSVDTYPVQQQVHIFQSALAPTQVAAAAHHPVPESMPVPQTVPEPVFQSAPVSTPVPEPLPRTPMGQITEPATGQNQQSRAHLVNDRTDYVTRLLSRLLQQNSNSNPIDDLRISVKERIENRTLLLKFKKDQQGENAKCAICLNDFEEKEYVRLLKCIHMFHKECIDRWLTSNETCPSCRAQIIFHAE